MLPIILINDKIFYHQNTAGFCSVSTINKYVGTKNTATKLNSLLWWRGGRIGDIPACGITGQEQFLQFTQSSASQHSRQLSAQQCSFVSVCSATMADEPAAGTTDKANAAAMDTAKTTSTANLIPTEVSNNYYY